MNNAALPYLKQIADALGSKDKNADKKRDEELTSIAKNISTATVTNNNVSMAGNENTKAINETLAKGLIVTVQDGSSEVEKSIFALMFEMLQSALCATVTENNTTVVKGIAQLVSEQNAVLGQIKSAQDDIRSALYDDSGTNPVTVLTKLGGIETKLNSINSNVSTVASKIETGDANIVTALGTTNSTLASVNDGVAAANLTLNSIDDNTENIQVTASIDSQSMASAVSDGIDDSYSFGNYSGPLHTIADSLTDSNDGIQTHVASIDTKTPNPNP